MGCLVWQFKQYFSIFKQHYTYFHTFFYPHIFSKNTNKVLEQHYQTAPQILRACLIEWFKPTFSIFNQLYTHFHIYFHTNVFKKPQTTLFKFFYQTSLKNFKFFFLFRERERERERDCFFCFCFFVERERQIPHGYDNEGACIGPGPRHVMSVFTVNTSHES